jgi:seryl-tRNA synthetase
VSSADNLRAEQKAASKKVGKASPDERPALLAAAKDLADKVKAAEAEQSRAEAAFTAAHMAISNVIIDGVPAGGEDDYVVLDTVGEPRPIDNPKDHVELGESLGLIDLERGAKVSGSRFYFLTGAGALLQLGLLQLAAQLAQANGFTLMIPPVLVRPEIMAGTGFLGAHSEEVYRLEADDLYLVGTSEVALAGYHTTQTRFSISRTVRCAMRGGRRASGARRAATERTPAASFACTSSTRSKASSTASPTRPRPNTNGCSAGNAKCWARSRFRIA